MVLYYSIHLHTHVDELVHVCTRCSPTIHCTNYTIRLNEISARLTSAANAADAAFALARDVRQTEHATAERAVREQVRQTDVLPLF